MEAKSPRPWYKKKRYIIPSAVLATAFIVGSGDTSPTEPVIAPAVQQAVQQNIVKPVAEPVQVEKTVVSKPTKQTESQPSPYYQPTLSNDNYYTNVDGNTVHSPAYTDDDSVPAGASAQCRDGTYSFSQNRRGTCSRHGGVAQWL